MAERVRAIDIAHKVSDGEISPEEAEAMFKQIEAARSSGELVPIPQEHQGEAARVLSNAFGARLKPLGILVNIQDLREADENGILGFEERVRHFSAGIAVVIVGVVDGFTDAAALGMGRLTENTSFMVSSIIHRAGVGWERGKK